ncbi:Lar family restriction alleviation protein [uncultured Fretibacterium sp.]|uniref:Lar family restriction alleviation protein n=1 Tax=uncultured Fretibacterium sp. TaxID=1678694 RepID=UPI00344C59A4
MTDLKPCPFCGGKAKERYEYLNGVFVQCNECWISTHVFSSQGAATRFWNRRVGDV